MRFFGTLIAAVAGVVFGTPAMAQDTTTIYGKVADGYVFQDMAFVGTDESVTQGGMSGTWGKFTLDGWLSVENSDKGEFGDRGFGDEFDLTGNYDDAVETPLGKVNYQVSVSYFALASFDKSSDDLIQVYTDFNLPLSFGDLTVTPFVRPIQWFGLTDAIKDETLVRYGFRAAYQFDDGWSIDGDISENKFFETGNSHLRGQINLRKDLGDGVQVFLEGKFTEETRSVFAIGTSKTF